MDKYSFIGNGDVAAFEQLYQQYKKDQNSVDITWKKFFDGFEFAREHYGEETSGSLDMNKEFKVINLINSYRNRGHLFTKTNPVRERRKYFPTLEIENFGLEAADLETVFQSGNQIGIGPSKLKDIVAHLEKTYCQSIGAEFMYIRQPEKIQWLTERLESTKNTPDFNVEQKKHILHKLNQAVVFENFLHTKFVGQKRFSLEGAETMIPAMDMLVEHGSHLGIQEFVVGMAHRGRLNVLANIFNKTYSEIFKEFEGTDYEESVFSGDVKYHLGFSCDITADNGKKVHMCLSPNPSHLEAVDPIVQGIARASLDRKYNGNTDAILPILIHGDAAIAGQGIVYEVIQMSQLEAYKNGGTMHIVINNQIGFTTNYLDARSSVYCTDVGKVTLSPVFHVNGDDVEAVCLAMKTAIEYRQKFKQDVFIDLLCYRKYGHNEGDEPRFTQPILYKAIAKHPNPREIYKEKLLKSSVIDNAVVEEMEEKFKQLLQERLEDAKQIKKSKITSFMEEEWKSITKAKAEDFEKSPSTAVSKKKVLELAKKINAVPKDIKLFKKMERILLDRQEMLDKNTIDWGMAELLAYATLLDEGHPVRFSGQDVERGTFSHRHAVMKVEDSEEEYCPLAELNPKAPFEIYNSLLSEYGVLGFEYGYALATPNTLTIWEAQFGDFFNGAQIIYDQFFCCAEDKWNVFNGMVTLLPHGYEGQGAEHSSARIERFLLLCAENNMQVANCTTPANFFHLLRRQLKRNFRKPLIVFTPKKLLRYPKCVSSVEELSTGGFQEIIDDETVKAAQVTKLVLCSGKVYYDLMEEREKIDAKNVAIVRIEQLYPFPQKQLNAILGKYKNAKSIIWAQEEPENMGPWLHVLRNCRNMPIQVVARHESASPATGSHKRHEIELLNLLNSIFQNEKQAVQLGVE